VGGRICGVASRRTLRLQESDDPVLCAEIRENLTEYQLGLLDEVEAGALRLHLDECAGCREELAALERLDALIAPAEELRAPDGLWLAVHARMKPRQAAWWRAWLHAPRPALAMAAAMLLAVGGIWLGLRGGPETVSNYEVLGADYQEQQIVAQWSQPLADDAALSVMYASLNGVGEAQ